ncbi:MAG: ribosome biogenesis GTP-binding protein YihA/YsxC [Deltaproteobacteria bacterium]
MKILSAEFIKSAVSPSDYPSHEMLEIAFVGRSNVGKSSLINALTNRRALARTSNTPGRTQLLNFFVINNQFVFVDLPGYGFAKVSIKLKNEWGEMIQTYLETRTNLKAVVIILDVRRDPVVADIEFIKWLRLNGLAVIVVTTKIDKLSTNQKKIRIAIIKKMLGDTIHDDIIAFSAHTLDGREVLWRRLMGFLS